MPATATVTAGVAANSYRNQPGFNRGEADSRRPAPHRDSKIVTQGGYNRAPITRWPVPDKLQGRELGGSSRGYRATEARPTPPCRSSTLQSHAHGCRPSAALSGHPQALGTAQGYGYGSQSYAPAAAVLEQRPAARLWFGHLSSAHAELRRRTQPGIRGSVADLPRPHAQFRPWIQPASSNPLQALTDSRATRADSILFGGGHNHRRATAAQPQFRWRGQP